MRLRRRVPFVNPLAKPLLKGLSNRGGACWTSRHTSYPRPQRLLSWAHDAIAGLGILISAMIVSGCTSSGTVGVQPAKPLPPDPLAAVKTDDPDGLLTMVATVGNAPGQQRTVTVSGKHMQLHGVCVGTGSMIIDANGSGGQLCVRGVCGSGASGLGPRWLHHAAACRLLPAACTRVRCRLAGARSWSIHAACRQRDPRRSCELRHQRGHLPLREAVKSLEIPPQPPVATVKSAMISLASTGSSASRGSASVRAPRRPWLSVGLSQMSVMVCCGVSARRPSR